MLEQRWREICKKIGRDGEPTWEFLTSAYSDQSRAYHNLTHIEDCLSQLDQHRELAGDVLSAEFAIWFHDVIYDTRKSDNEERSAELAAEFLSGTTIAETVVDLILQTKHNGHAREGDGALMCDIDLSILGRKPEEYRRYAEAIRKEYHWVPINDYIVGRTKVLRGFLEREEIFSMPDFRDRFEQPARRNITEEIERLGNP